MNCIEQLFQIGYKNELDKLSVHYRRLDRKLFFSAVAGMGDEYGPYLDQLYNYFAECNTLNNLATDQDTLEEQMLSYIRDSKIKGITKIRKFYSKYITRWRRISSRVDYNPIKNILKFILYRNKLLQEINNRPTSDTSIVTTPKLKILSADI